MLYQMMSKDDLIAIAQSAVQQQKWNAAIKTIGTIQAMEANDRVSILIEVRLSGDQNSDQE